MSTSTTAPTTAPVILQILPELHSGGVERGTLDIAQAIIAHGGKAIVASAGGALVDSLTHLGAHHIPLPLARKSPWGIWQNAQLLTSLIERAGVDIVHARSRAPAWAGWLAAKRTNARFITSFHGFYGLNPAIKRHYNRIMVQGEQVIAVSHFIKEHILEHYAANLRPGADIRVIHRGVDTQHFNPAHVSPAHLAELSAHWQLEAEHRPIILLPGRITRWKGQHVLLEALAALPHREFCAIIAGHTGKHTDYAEELKATIYQHNLQDNVRMVDATRHMPAAYMLADIIVSPSTAPEAFGRIPTEAQAMGKPIIATNHGGACETVCHGTTGTLVPPSDAQALSAAIAQTLALSAEEKATMATTARAHILRHFSLEVMQARTMEVYNSLLPAEKRLVA